MPTPLSSSSSSSFGFDLFPRARIWNLVLRQTPISQLLNANFLNPCLQLVLGLLLSGHSYGKCSLKSTRITSSMVLHGSS